MKPYQILYAAHPQSEPSEMVPVVLASVAKELTAENSLQEEEIKRLRRMMSVMPESFWENQEEATHE